MATKEEKDEKQSKHLATEAKEDAKLGLRVAPGWRKGVALANKKYDISPTDFDRSSYVRGSLSSGSLTIDLTLGGGAPRGRISGFVGPEGSGKSTLVYHFALEAIRLGIPVFIYDHEAAIDPNYLKGIGFDIKSKRFLRLFNYSQPSGSGMETFRHIRMLCDNIEPIDDSLPSALFLVDSLASMMSEGEAEDEDKASMAEQARMFSQGFRRIKVPLSKCNASLIFTNQVREKPGVQYGNPEYEPGGKAPRFYSDVYARIGFMSVPTGGRVEREEDETGKAGSYMHSKLKTAKNKVFPPFRESLVRIRFGRGFDPYYDVKSFLEMTGQCQPGKGGIILRLKEPTKSVRDINDMLQDKKKLKLLAADKGSVLNKFLRGQMKDSTAFDLYNDTEEARPVVNKKRK